MILEQDRIFLLQAAAPALARIRQDRDEAPDRLAPLLDHLAGNLFDPGLNVNRLKLACGVRDNSISIVFHKHLGVTPHHYISRARLECAERLLASPELKIWVIAEMIGYAGLSAFARAFARYYGQRPRAYRQAFLAKARKLANDGAEPQGTRADAKVAEAFSFNAKCLRQAQTGILQPIEPLLARLEGLYPLHRPAPNRENLGYERVIAELIWRRIHSLPIQLQHSMVAEKHAFRSTALFDLLREKSREVGRGDRRRGVDLAHLALASLERVSLPGDRLPTLRAQAWTWIANAERLAHDSVAAERALHCAAAAFVPMQAWDPAVATEFFHVKVALRLIQDQFQEALLLADRADAQARLSQDPTLIARTLALRGNTLWYLANHDASVVDLEEAVAVALDQDDPHLSFSIAANLAAAYISTGHFAKARRALDAARCGLDRLDSPVLQLYLAWTDGHLRRSMQQYDLAESYFREAYEGLYEYGEMTIASSVGLDLSLLLASQGKHLKALHVVCQIVPILEKLQLPQESLSALHVLQESAEGHEISTSILQTLRGSVPGLAFIR